MDKHKNCLKYIGTNAVNLLRIAISIWVIIVQIGGAQIQEQQLYFKDEKLVGSITTEDLHKILDGYRAEPFEKKENALKSIFTTFPRLLLPYERPSDNALNFSPALEILDTSPTFHKVMDKNQSFTNETFHSKPIELWLSFPPQNNIPLDIGQILNSSILANSKRKGTVTTLLLQSQPQILNNLTIPLMQKNIRKIIHFIKENSQDNLTFGIILDARNCQQNVERIRNLPLSMVDILIFKINDDISQDQGYQNGYENCHRNAVQHLGQSRTQIGFIAKWPISIDQQTGLVKSLGEDEKWLTDLKEWRQTNSVTLILEGFTPSLSSPPKLSATTNTTNETQVVIPNQEDLAGIDIASLRRPLVLSKQFLGMTIANSNLNRTDKLIDSKFVSLLYEYTRKITVGDVTETELTVHWKGVQDFVDQMAIFKRGIVRIKSGSGGVDIFEDQVPMRLFISMYISNDDLSVSRRGIENAGTIAGKGNDIYPETVTGIMLNCEDYPVQNEIRIENRTGRHWHHFIAPNVQHAREVTARQTAVGTKLEVGIILPIEFCNHFSSINEAYPNLETVNLIVFKVGVTLQEIKAGVSELVGHLKKLFQGCKRKSEVFLAQATGSIKVEFRVQPTGCDGTYKDIKGLANLVGLWEEINSWASTEKSVVTMDTAFDELSGLRRCGWWRMVTQNGTLAFEDKRAAAIKLYEKLNPDSALGASAPAEGQNLLLIILLPTVLFVILLTATASFLVIRYRARYVVGRQEADEFFKGMDEKSELDTGILNFPKNDGNSSAHCQAYDKDSLEVPKGNFEIDQSPTGSLGSGEFGLVCRGTVKRKEGEGDKVKVAVKMINDRKGSSIQAGNKALRGLMSEIKILSHVGDHKHIVGLLGAYTAELRRGRVYVFLELCPMGSLDKHLRSFGNQKEKKVEADGAAKSSGGDDGGKEDRYVNLKQKNILDDALAIDLLRWSQEICSGMEFLTSKNVVHADLAARNVLLNAEKCAKIADFGLSRRLYEYTNYVKKQQEPLPWRWMAPESLRRLEFNQKTDVWAFGVTVWEIYTLGDQPYPGLSWDVGFVSRLEEGLRLTEPSYNEHDMFEIMSSCWDADPSRRPTFSQLASLLSRTENCSTSYANEIGSCDK